MKIITKQKDIYDDFKLKKIVGSHGLYRYV